MLIASLITLQLIIFTVLIFVFRRIMAQNVVLATKHLEELTQDYNEKEKQVDQQLEEANSKSQEIVSSAQNEAEKVRSETLKQAQEESDRIIRQARTQADEMIQQADKSRNQLIAEMEERIAKGAVNRACDLCYDALPDEFRTLVHSQWVEDLIENGFSKAERLRLPEGTEEIEVISAFALTDEQRKRLSKKLKDAFGHEMTIKEQVDPKVVAGLVVNIGSLVLDGSLKNKIKEKAR
jgi:cell division septum initiation protein DivIVA